MSFSAHLPVLLPQRDSDQLAPLPWPSAARRRGTSAPSCFASVSASKFAAMQAHERVGVARLVLSGRGHVAVVRPFGKLLGMTLLEASARVLDEMATFAEAGVSGSDEATAVEG